MSKILMGGRLNLDWGTLDLNRGTLTLNGGTRPHYNSSTGCYIGVARIVNWGGGGANHKSHAMTLSEIFKKVTFCRAKIS